MFGKKKSQKERKKWIAAYDLDIWEVTVNANSSCYCSFTTVQGNLGSELIQQIKVIFKIETLYTSH